MSWIILPGLECSDNIFHSEQGKKKTKELALCFSLNEISAFVLRISPADFITEFLLV